MKKQQLLALLLSAIALVTGIDSFLRIDFPVGLEGYFEQRYYNQFGPLAISIELLTAGIYLLRSHTKTHFALALFGFTALLDILFDFLAVFTSQVPLYGRILFMGCGVLSLWISYANPFGLKRISWVGVTLSFLLGLAIDLYFNNIQFSF